MLGEDSKNIAVSALTNPQPPRDPTTAADEDNQPNESGAEASPTAAISAGSPAPATGAAAPAQSAAATPSTAPQTEEKHGRNLGQRVLDSIVSAFGGVDQYQVDRDPNTGKLVVTAQRGGPGQAWKTVIGAALRGAAAGAMQSGPGSKGRAGAAGLSAGMGMVEDADKNKLNLANEDFAAQQKALVTKAQVAHYNQEIASSAWQMNREKTKVDTDAIKSATDLQNALHNSPGSEDYGTYKSFEEFLQTHGENGKQIAQMSADGELRSVPVFDKDHNVAGVHIVKIAPAWNEQKTTQDQQVDFGPVLDKDGTAKPNMHTVPAGSMTNHDLFTQQQASTERWLKYHKEHGDVTPKDEFEQKGKEKIEGVRQAGENSREASRETAAASREQTKLNNKKNNDLTTAAKNRAELADNVEANLKHLEDLIKKRPDMFGKFKGNINEFMAKHVGSDDADVLDWKSTIDNLGKANNGMHQMRSKYGLEGQIANLRLANGKHGLAGAINSIRQSADQFRKEVHPGEADFDWNKHPVVPTPGAGGK